MVTGIGISDIGLAISPDDTRRLLNDPDLVDRLKYLPPFGAAADEGLPYFAQALNIGGAYVVSGLKTPHLLRLAVLQAGCAHEHFLGAQAPRTVSEAEWMETVARDRGIDTTPYSSGRLAITAGERVRPGDPVVIAPDGMVYAATSMLRVDGRAVSFDGQTAIVEMQRRQGEMLRRDLFGGLDHGSVLEVD